MKIVEKTPENYERLIDECCQVAGNGDCFWNERFVSALNRRGLTLATSRHPHDANEWYPGGIPVQAPHPFAQGQETWPIGSLIVWIPRIPELCFDEHRDIESAKKALDELTGKSQAEGR